MNATQQQQGSSGIFRFNAPIPSDRRPFFTDSTVQIQPAAFSWFHQMPQTPKSFVPPKDIDTEGLPGKPKTIIVNRMNLTAMKEFADKSLEEHRLEFYNNNNLISSKKAGHGLKDFNNFITDTPAQSSENESSSHENSISSGSSNESRPRSDNPSIQQVTVMPSTVNAPIVFNFPNSQPIPATATSQQAQVTFNMPPVTAVSFDQTRMMFTLHFT